MASERSPFTRLFGAPEPVVSLIRLHGVIGPSSRFARNLDDAGVAKLLEEALKPSKLVAVALSINSPGGSPVQSRLIAERLRAETAKKKVPLLAFCEDVAASGGYMLACAADEIYADHASIIGSIGVVSAGFGFDKAIAKLGVERRLTTAGDHKARLDPFSPLKRDDQAWLEGLQARVHQQFTRFVQNSRRDRLDAQRSNQIFSGDVFLGDEAVEYGLIDGVQSMRSVIDERFGADVRIEPVTRRRSLMERLGGAAATRGRRALGAELAAGALAELEEAALWARFGL